MKKNFILLFLAFSFTPYVIFGQKKVNHWDIGIFVATPDQRTFKPYIDTWIDYYMGKVSSTTKEIRYPITGLSASYSTKNNMAIRLKYGISFIRYNSEGVWVPDTNVHATINSSLKQTNYHFSIGIHYKVDYNKLSFNVGIDALYNRYGKGKLNYFEDYKQFSNGTLISDLITEDNWITAKGYSIGLAPFIGIGLNFKQFSFGFETSIPFLYRTFGDDTDSWKQIDVLNGTVNENTQLTDIHYKSTKFDNLRATINISYLF